MCAFCHYRLQAAANRDELASRCTSPYARTIIQAHNQNLDLRADFGAKHCLPQRDLDAVIFLFWLLFEPAQERGGAEAEVHPGGSSMMCLRDLFLSSLTAST